MWPIFFLIWLGVSVLMIASMWKVFAKAGRPGWAAIIPIYNLGIILRIAGKPGWWLLLFLIPLVNLIIGILTYIAFAAKFGKGVGFAFGLFFLGLIFWPILAFGDARYSGASPAA